LTVVVRPALRKDVPGVHGVWLVVRENMLTSSIIAEEHCDEPREYC